MIRSCALDALTSEVDGGAILAIGNERYEMIQKFRVCTLFGLCLIGVLATTWATPLYAADVNVVNEDSVPIYVIAGAPVSPLPEKPAVDEGIAELGSRLFHETRLSANGQVSCASCHVLEQGGDDGMASSIGVSGKQIGTNAPTVFNVAMNFSFFWDGRAETMEDQMDGPVHSPDEMASSWADIIDVLNASAEYQQSFDDLYDGEISERTIKDAIATFQRTLVTGGSKFDRFISGDRTLFSAAELQGYESFMSLGCVSCHQGVLLGGNLYQRLGIFEDYFGDRGNVSAADYGRFNVTGAEEDRYYFKVPSLRNVALTAPYLHDGSVPYLADVVSIMAYYQLGLSLDTNQIEYLVAFLKTLTGTHQYLNPNGDEPS